MISDVNTYCDGAKMAYEDCAGIVEKMINDCPPEIKDWIVLMKPLVEAFYSKANSIHAEAESYFFGKKQ